MKQKINRWLGIEQHINDQNTAIALLQIQLGAVAQRTENLQEDVTQMDQSMSEFMLDIDDRITALTPKPTKKKAPKKK